MSVDASGASDDCRPKLTRDSGVVTESEHMDGKRNGFLNNQQPLSFGPMCTVCHCMLCFCPMCTDYVTRTDQRLWCCDGESELIHLLLTEARASCLAWVEAQWWGTRGYWEHSENTPSSLFPPYINAKASSLPIKQNTS